MDVRINQNWKDFEVKTISVNEAEQSAKIKSVKKQWRKTKCSWYRKKCGLLRMYATTSENCAQKKECAKLRGKVGKGHGRRKPSEILCE